MKPLIPSSAASTPSVSGKSEGRAFENLHGVFSRVARREGVSRQFVHQVAKGVRTSMRISAALHAEMERVRGLLDGAPASSGGDSAPIEEVDSACPRVLGVEESLRHVRAAREGGFSTDDYEELSHLRARMDRLDAKLDNRPENSICRICGCADDNRCAVPEGRYGFTRCRWNVEFDCCTNPSCVDKAFRRAERSAAAMCVPPTSMAQAFAETTALHTWRPL